MEKRQQQLFTSEPAPWELDEAEDRSVAQVVFASGAGGLFDYLVPDRLRDQVQPGRRVEVPFGRGNRKLHGYCVQVLPDRSDRPRQRLKEILSVVDADTLLSPPLLQLTEWMSQYYLCSWGQAIETVVPSSVRGQAGTRQVTLLTVPTHVAARLTQLKLPEKQARALRCLAASPSALTQQQLAQRAQCTEAPIRGLRKKGLVRAEVRRIQHHKPAGSATARVAGPTLNADQQRALQTVVDALQAGQHKTILVHGVTGSGKTEVYIRAIEEVIQFGRQAIVLVPEISLTPQTEQRFCSRFDQVAVLHSHLSDVQRHWHWQRIADGQVQVVVGARSAVFAPTPNLGLVVVDEEHDTSFKQDTTPRYHAREVARWRTQREQAPLVLGSATPSLESWQAAQEGTYQLVALPRRVLNLPLPDVAAIDLRMEFRDRRSRGAISRPLHQAVNQALQNDGQVILLLNRRGFATNIQCPACGYVVVCPHCDISLTHHRERDAAVCHYCDFQMAAPPQCPECNFEGIRYSGLGTQRLEAEVRRRFPGAVCLRMDSDTMQKPGSHEQALARFRRGEVKILLGTQMIAKGLDFPNVTLVGVINADTALHFPDFRAAERTFQLVTQVAGRTGRGSKGGRVLVQTFSPEHPAIEAAMRHDYVAFAGGELPNRAEYGYPPASAMIRLVVRGPTASTTEAFAQQIADRLRQELDEAGLAARVLGPAAAPIAKLRGKFRFHSLVLCQQASGLRQAVGRATAKLQPPDQLQWIVDVDPLDML